MSVYKLQTKRECRDSYIGDVGIWNDKVHILPIISAHAKMPPDSRSGAYLRISLPEQLELMNVVQNQKKSKPGNRTEDSEDGTNSDIKYKTSPQHFARLG